MKWSHVDHGCVLGPFPTPKWAGRMSCHCRCRDAVLAQMRRYRDPNTDYVFPGASGTVIADSTLRYLIHDMGYKELATTHGFRATFKTWAEDDVDLRPLVIEAALAHAKKGMTRLSSRQLPRQEAQIDGGVGRLHLAGEAVRSEGSVVATTRQHAHA